MLWEAEVNKTQLIDALAERLGDKKIAAAAVAGLVDLVVRAVNSGDKVTITGFGVFEKRARAARMARNPRTGQSVKVKKTNVPTFRPGTLFREVVSGARKLPRVTGSVNGAAATRPAVSTASGPATRKAPTAPEAPSPAVPSPAVPSPEAQATVTEATTNAAKATTNTAKTPKATKTPKAAKTPKTPKAAKTPKASKKEPKATSKAAPAVPAKVTVRKAVKKSAATK